MPRQVAEWIRDSVSRPLKTQLAAHSFDSATARLWQTDPLPLAIVEPLLFTIVVSQRQSLIR
ncbi:uncharacterized protein TrAtP1_011451 [Trichoderma atroviride]|uniref:uncharacterized protein n=1 Tax=Hypocrea atroviridis TaxID=63577 RepID=UPI00332EBCE2|nr:hypothetical protein TrAtP1_011451 [Trichoderma atroviride]